MPWNALLDDYERMARRSRSPSELFSQSEAFAREIGFHFLAVVQGMAFFRPDGGYIRMDNFGGWGDVFVERRYYRDDPALLTAQSTNRAFTWQQMVNLGRYGHRQRKIVTEAGRHGLRNGLTVPVGVFGEPAGCCSFATSTGELPPRPLWRIAALLACEAFAEARRLHGYPARAQTPPRLSERRVECLRWAAMAKTDVEIAAIMRIAPSTVRTYMTDLRRAFGVYSRTQLALHAVHFGIVGYDEVIPQG